jgi:diguanylate cyclase
MNIPLLRTFSQVLRERPSPADVASVVRATPFGASISAANALLFVLGTWASLGGPFLAGWLLATLGICVFVLRKSRRARNVIVTEVTSRAARRLLSTTVLLSAPWAYLAIWVLPAGSAFERTLVLLVCAGTFIGAAMMLQRTLLAAVIFTGVVNAGVIAGCFLSADHELFVVTLYCLLCASFVILNALQTGETARERDRMVDRLSDANRELEEAYNKISILAMVDTLTGLPNRKAFGEAADRDLVNARCDGRVRAAMLFDLDNFKNVNDSYGHLVGDELLKVIGQRICEVLKGEGILSRLGGDEFALLVPIGLAHPDAEALAGALVQAVSEPVTVAGLRILPNTSVGVALYPEHAETIGDLLRMADTALARAKDRGKSGWFLFDRDLGRELDDMNLIAAELQSALEVDCLTVHYQPKIDLRSGKMRGAEALLRWTHPRLGPIPPDRFLATAAERAMMHRVSEFVFTRVARDVLSWREAGLDVGPVAINVHPVDLKDPDLLMRLIRGLVARGLGPEAVSLEITEGCFFGRGTDSAAMILDAIADLGFRLSLDDFGTGHAALTHLRSLPVDEIKIDKSFVANIATSDRDRAIVDATLAIARGMGLTSVAEGVETVEQIVVLRDMGADFGQGYYWSRPLAPTMLREFVRRNAPASSPIRHPDPVALSPDGNRRAG